MKRTLDLSYVDQPLIMCKKVRAVYIYWEPNETYKICCGPSVKLLKVRAGGTQSYHCPLKV
jgi:hypothetical protein